ncbi:MAG: ABC transporter ATP-binding protein [Oscillatoriales cyanobacterium]|nr:MAG: ABC transporter ATP-binding protein [Oscillatoriales cyanobacterium]
MTVFSERKTDRAEVLVKDLCFAYPQQPSVLQGVSFAIQPGDRVALLGPTGSGKSTLLEQLIGLKLPTAGEVWIGGMRVEPRTLPQIRRRLGFCFQDANDQLFMPTILEDVMFGPLNYGMPIAQAKNQARDLLARFGLDVYEARSAHELSGGQKRLVALAAVLALEPAILILDEPTTGLDPRWRRSLARVLGELPTQAIVIASHDLHWIRQTTDRALVLYGGQIREDCSTERLLGDRSLLESYDLPLDY